MLTGNWPKQLQKVNMDFHYVAGKHEGCINRAKKVGVTEINFQKVLFTF